MHFLCSTFGSSGDVFPMLGLALELRRRGHEVTLATNEHFRKLSAAYDIPFEPLGSEAAFKATVENPDLWHPQRAFRHVFQSMSPILQRHYDLHVERARQDSVVGITSCFGFGARLAQETHGLPVITVHLQPSVMWSDRDPPALPGVSGPRWLRSLLFRVGERFFIDPVVCPFLNPWRRQLGLAPVKNICRWWHSPTAVIGLFPEWFAPPQPDWPPNVTLTDFPLWNDQTDDGLADDVAAFLDAGDPPLVFTPGSTMIFGRNFFEAAVQACRMLRRRGLFLTRYPEQLPRPLPDGITHFPYVPLDRLLPRAAAFVHHGGIGSLSQGMLAGKPQLVMPLAHDQFDNAARIKRLGIGNALSPARFTGPRLGKMLQQLLESRDVAKRCETIAERLKPRDGLSLAADSIERRVEAAVV